MKFLRYGLVGLVVGGVLSPRTALLRGEGTPPTAEKPAAASRSQSKAAAEPAVVMAPVTVTPISSGIFELNQLDTPPQLQFSPRPGKPPPLVEGVEIVISCVVEARGEVTDVEAIDTILHVSTRAGMVKGPINQTMADLLTRRGVAKKGQSLEAVRKLFEPWRLLAVDQVKRRTYWPGLKGARPVPTHLITQVGWFDDPDKNR